MNIVTFVRDLLSIMHNITFVKNLLTMHSFRKKQPITRFKKHREEPRPTQQHWHSWREIGAKRTVELNSSETELKMGAGD